MNIIVGLKFLHYASLFTSGGLGVANALLIKAHQKAGPAPAAPFQKTYDYARSSWLNKYCNPMAHRNSSNLSNIWWICPRLGFLHETFRCNLFADNCSFFKFYLIR